MVFDHTAAPAWVGVWLQVGVLDELSKFPPGLVADMVGLGTWRLNGECA
jgi:hypothetical protein